MYKRQYLRATDANTPYVEATALQPPSIANSTMPCGSKHTGFGANDAPALCSIPVSYTHLDVYKRQVLTQIGNEGDAPNTVTSVVTVAQLGQILPAITGIVTANEAAYQAYIDANPNLFSSPATAAEVQAMVVAVNAALAINDFGIRNVSIYPNPSNAIFNIEIAVNASIELYDAIGKSLKSDKIIEGVTALNLANYSDGVYFLKITNESNQTKTVRLIKK